MRKVVSKQWDYLLTLAPSIAYASFIPSHDTFPVICPFANILECVAGINIEMSVQKNGVAQYKVWLYVANWCNVRRKRELRQFLAENQQMLCLM